VDWVAVSEQETAEQVIRLLRPAIYAKGKEFEDRSRRRPAKIIAECKALEDVGGRIEFIGETLGSSTALVETLVSRMAENGRSGNNERFGIG
jgi:bifunctional ADP-heptose synthase (sugar kinase/adenylyltransferase)